MEDLNGAVEDFRKAYTLSAQDRERGVLQKEITRLQKSARIQGGQEAPKLAAKKAKEYVNKKLRVEKNAEKGRHIVAEKSLAADEKVLAQIPPFALVREQFYYEFGVMVMVGHLPGAVAHSLPLVLYDHHGLARAVQEL